MTDRELMQLALEMLTHCRVFVTTREKIKHPEGTSLYDETIEALRARLAQPEPGRCKHGVWAADHCYQCERCGEVNPAEIHTCTPKEQKPVAIRLSNGVIDVLGGVLVPIGTLLYTVPPQREWQGLTDEEIWSDGSTMGLSEAGIRKFARAIEAKLKEKNT